MLPIVLVNSRKVTVVRVVEVNGDPLATLDPGEVREIFCALPSRPLARFERIEFTDQGARTTLRPGFEEPQAAFPVEFIYMDEGGKGPAITTRIVNGAPAHFMRGIPVRLDVVPADDWAVYERVELGVLDEKLQPSFQHSGYMERVREVTDRGTERSVADLKRLQRVLEEMAAPAEDVRT